MKFLIIIIFFIQLTYSATTLTQLQSYASDYGMPLSGIPSHCERNIQSFINIARIDPACYKQKIYPSLKNNVLNDSYYSPVKPVWMHPKLIEAGRQHSDDMQTCGWGHQWCDGKSSGTMVPEYFPCQFSGDNIASWCSCGNSVVGAWICDSFCSGCCPDGVGNTAHRSTIMSSSKTIVGLGCGGGGLTAYYSKCDTIYDREIHSIYDGSILQSGGFFGGSNDFYATFYNENLKDANDIKGYVRVDGIAYEMELFCGVRYRGNYHIQISDLPPKSNGACREFFFEFKGGGKRWVYPLIGSLVYGCNIEYVRTQHLKEMDVFAIIASVIITPIILVILIVIVILILGFGGVFKMCKNINIKNIKFKKKKKKKSKKGLFNKK